MNGSPRVLLLGASGLLGHQLLQSLPEAFSTVAVSGRGVASGTDSRVQWLSARMDAAEPASIDAILDAAGAGVIVNATGAAPRSDAATMTHVNTRFPRALAVAAAARGARVVQISTDGVFSGLRGGYGESDAPDPVDDYGRSKLGGELEGPHLTIRTSFFGRSPRGTGLIEWLASQRGQTVDGFTDYRFSGIAASLLAGLIASAIGRALSGLYHVGGDPVTKYELLRAASRVLDLDVTVRPSSGGVAVDRTLDSHRFFEAVDHSRPTVTESLKALTSCGALLRS